MLKRLLEKLNLKPLEFPDYPAALNTVASMLAPNINPVVIASAATITITYNITFVSGTNTVSLIKLPTGFRGMFVIIPTGQLPLNTGGSYAGSDGTYESIPIKVAQTAGAGAVNKPIVCVSDGNFVYANFTG